MNRMTTERSKIIWHMSLKMQIIMYNQLISRKIDTIPSKIFKKHNGKEGIK